MGELLHFSFVVTNCVLISENVCVQLGFLQFLSTVHSAGSHACVEQTLYHFRTQSFLLFINDYLFSLVFLNTALWSPGGLTNSIAFIKAEPLCDLKCIFKWPGKRPNSALGWLTLMQMIEGFDLAASWSVSVGLCSFCSFSFLSKALYTARFLYWEAWHKHFRMFCRNYLSLGCLSEILKSSYLALREDKPSKVLWILKASPLGARSWGQDPEEGRGTQEYRKLYRL